MADAGRSPALHRQNRNQLSFRISSDARKPMAIAGALVLPEIKVGMIEVSTTRKPVTPRTRSFVSVTDASSFPMRQVPDT
jgi:hypothetical protein